MRLGHFTISKDFSGVLTHQIDQCGNINELNNRLNKVDALLNGTRNQYDGFDRLDNIAYSTTGVGTLSINPDDTEKYSYDANGNLTQVKKRIQIN